MKVLLSISTVAVALAAGFTAGSLRYNLVDSTGAVAQTQDSAETSVGFDNVADGEYVATVVRLDTNGNALGDPISQAFAVITPAQSVDPTSATYEAPAAIQVTFQ